MTVELGNRLALLTGLRLRRSVGIAGSISGLAQYVEAALPGSDRRPEPSLRRTLASTPSRQSTRS